MQSFVLGYTAAVRPKELPIDFLKVKWVYEAAPPKDNYLEGLEPLLAAADPEAFTLIDLRPLRAVAAPRTRYLSTPLVRYVFGFDMLLVMSGSTPSAGFPAP